ncbi:MAG: peptide-methionine (S)-S-oxide reductase MsrA [Candidatus Thorarchaeota archaeon]|nr:peptide-methionine (S)-S-oxide reductase MsrA [Candidatus Thorarchaeota archaeon]
MELATLGAGRFWLTEAVYQLLKGIKNVTPGYAGSHVENPTFEEVETGKTGHAEVVQIEFDPEEITYVTILKVFFAIHDPTTANRQGSVVGTQYRSVIFYHNKEQKMMAEQMKSRMDAGGMFRRLIVTEILPYMDFYPAEEEFRDYYHKHPEDPYCMTEITPSLDKVRETFQDLLKEQ